MIKQDTKKEKQANNIPRLV